jgi:hypothetical protein
MAKKYSAQEVADAITEARGLIGFAAQILGCARSTVYTYINDYVTVKQALADARENMLDLAEATLYKQIQEDQNMTAIIFYLKTQGKQRGYVERQELEHSGVVTWQEFIAEAQADIDSSDPYA